MVRSLFSVFLAACLGAASITVASAQSTTSGDITGTVTDPSGAVTPHATVTLTNAGTNASVTTTTSIQGYYRFSFVPSGTFNLSVSATGFQTQQVKGIVVTAGQPTVANFKLTLASASSSVIVTSTSDMLQTGNADVNTSFSTQMIQNIPNPGGDITYFAQTAPGVVMNTQSGYGNFVADGMPGTSNLFSINGSNNNDPFFGINNSGASNLMLGSNDIAEANVVNSPYSGQYGQYAGSQITYITKTGSNGLHGNAIYNWNGRELNANQFFANQAGLPTPFNNFNQWMANLQGPIRKNHTFFDVDYEGIRNVLPTASILTLVPSPQFQAATLANLALNGNAAQIPFYNQVFAIYNNAPGIGAATPAANNGGCQGFTGLPAGVPCALQFRTTPPNFNHEYVWSARVDHNFGAKDNAYIRVSRDNGLQPTFTSPFGPTFNEQSNQPQMNGQVAWTHIFSPNTVNEFKGSSNFYGAVFTPSDPAGALAALPTFLTFSGNPFTSVGAFGEPGPFFFPQGRRVFQYQILDDVSNVRGRHTFRLGFSWLHDNVTDLDFAALAGPVNGSLTTTLSDFFNGSGPATSLFQAFPSSNTQYIKMNTFGGYIADDIRVNPNLTVTLNLRIENYSNPSCDNNCFSKLASPFTGGADPAAASTPYNQLILTGQHSAYNDTQAVVWEPRAGIAWKPMKNSNTVIRTGAGIFADELPGALAESAAFNSPGLNSFIIGGGRIAPGVPGSLFTTTANANAALLTQFNSGGSFNTISAAVPGFTAPNFYSFPQRFFQPKYYKWNFEIQQGIGSKILLSANYSGMHGIRIPVADQGLNGFCPVTVCTSGFPGLPTTVPNAALGTVFQYLSGGTSNYNGLTVSAQRRLSASLNFTISYTWSHTFDDVSNGGVANEPFGILATNTSVTTLQDPHNIRGNYGQADYDVRNYVSANLVFTDLFRKAGFHKGPERLLGGWTLATNWFYRTGLPFSVVDNSALAALAPFNYSGVIFGSQIAPARGTCGDNSVNSPCFTTSQFAPAANGTPTGFGTTGRNSFFGPRFWDVDLSLTKDIRIKEHFVLSLGAQAFNLFNHANFDQPVGDLSNPLFGSIINTVGPPTSLLGSFVGAGSSPRFLEIKGMVRF
jgi:outer membrane receptor protein involved in Fe transport